MEVKGNTPIETLTPNTLIASVFLIYALEGLLIWLLGRWLKVSGLTLGRSYAALLLSVIVSLLLMLMISAAAYSAGSKLPPLAMEILSYAAVNILLVLSLRRLGGATWRQALIIALIALVAGEVIDRLAFGAIVS